MNFRTRISFYYLIATALLLALVFVFIYYIVYTSIYYNLDHNLRQETYKHLAEVDFKEGNLQFGNKAEWEAREHQETEVNPVFIQLIDKNRKIKDRSPNLKNDVMQVLDHVDSEKSYNAVLHEMPVRQMQLPFKKDGIIEGYLIAGVSISAQLHTLKNLRTTLLILYPTLLVFLFLISRFLAGKSIEPISSITATTDRISKNNLNERVALPTNKDEIYDLSASINHLLDRIENALIREKQFTSDASHELRTPLAVLKGTLEVTIRKPRTADEYQDKIKYALSEIDHMAELTEQLLTMARMEQDQISSVHKPLIDILKDLLDRNKPLIEENNIEINTLYHAYLPQVNEQLANLILGNIISNAIKFSPVNGSILIQTKMKGEQFSISIADEGNGIPESDLDLIFNPFYRSSRYSKVKGNGLGLSIALRAAQLLGAKISYNYNEPQGSIFEVLIPIS
ncbi:MAG: sensor histidine kinase [Weeksellaceae bacterium]